MDNSTSRPLPPQTHIRRPDDFRTQQENLELTDVDWQKIYREGSGKSTLIRRLLGYQPTDTGEPVVSSSVNECTKEAKEYPKEGTSLVYIDLPSIGRTSTECAFSTPEDQEKYCQLFRLRTIDYFILVSQSKFNQHEKMLDEYITKTLKKNFIFVQTKMDASRAEFGNQIIEEAEGFGAVKRRIRTDIQKQLDRSSAERIFLVSNNVLKVDSAGQQSWVYDNSRDYEFDLLVKQIQDDMLGEGGLTALKGEAFILATDTISKSIIQGKANTLRTQSWGWATVSGLVGAVPIQGISAACDASIIISQAIHYFNMFDLNPQPYIGDGSATEQRKKLIAAMSTSMGPRVAAVLATAIGPSVAEEAVKAIPIVGVVIGGPLGLGISFASTCTILRQLINFCETVALETLQQN